MNKLVRIAILSLLLVAGCTVIAKHRLDELYGTEQTRYRIKSPSELSENSKRTWHKVKSVLDSRCVVCHSCYDAPCQLKLASPEGIDRGASKHLVYDGTRIFESTPARLGVDAQKTQEWRAKNFFPVLNERAQSPGANLDGSVFFRLLDLKRRAAPQTTPRYGSDFDFSLDRSQVCPTITEMEGYERENPNWGMPFGLPAITDSEFSILKTWLEDGAQMPVAHPVPSDLSRTVVQWERLLNQDSLKAKLASRYVYEHLFLADLVFDTVDRSRIFRLVRSETNSNLPAVLIPTRLPTDDPRKPFFYRFVPNDESRVAKTQMVYTLNPKRLARWKQLFFDANYEVTEFPGYEKRVSTNPFKVFQQIPLSNKYEFLLDDALYFVQGFIKGPVCRGGIAVNVINDHFWVFFVKPGLDQSDRTAKFLAEESDRLSMPGELGNDVSAITKWRHYEAQEAEYLKAKRAYLRELVDEGVKIDLNALWDGAQRNPNAALTVFRHYDSATAMHGMLGPPPETAWVLGYPLFERLHYLLVAEFDIFGNLGHQLLTRLYMDFLRVEAENAFLVLLPKSERKKEHDSWYQGFGAHAKEYVLRSENFDWTESGIQYSSTQPKLELYDLIKKRMNGALREPPGTKHETPAALLSLSQLTGIPISFLPELSMLRLKRNNGKHELYSLVANRAHSNVAVLYLEEFRRIPEQDTLSLTKGVAGSYPNAFLSVAESELEQLVSRVASLRSEQDYRSLLDAFGVRRTSSSFWEFSDWLQTEARKGEHIELGLLDYNRLENR